MRTITLSILTFWHGANGLFMLLAPEHWYESVPGVTPTGPFNSHFIADIAIAFLACAIALALAVRLRGKIGGAMLIAPAMFLGGHSLLHLFELFHHGLSPTDIVRDTLTILTPGFLPAVIAWRDWRSSPRGEN